MGSKNKDVFDNGIEKQDQVSYELRKFKDPAIAFFDEAIGEKLEKRKTTENLVFFLHQYVVLIDILPLCSEGPVRCM